MTERCVLLLGGSFDPVHQGHIALARYFCALLHPDELRLIPAGRPWQKPELTTPPEHRIAMLQAAFSDWGVPIVIDSQEIEREGATYAIDTLRALRNELGDEVALVMLLGADQLLNLHTWRDWQKLFDLAAKHKDISLITHPYVEAYIKKGFPSLRMKWSSELKRYFNPIPVSSNHDYHLTEFHFLNSAGEELGDIEKGSRF